MNNSLYHGILRGKRAFSVSGNEGTLQKPDANSLTDYIVTYKRILVTVKYHYIFKMSNQYYIAFKKKNLRKLQSRLHMK